MHAPRKAGAVLADVLLNQIATANRAALLLVHQSSQSSKDIRLASAQGLGGASEQCRLASAPSKRVLTNSKITAAQLMSINSIKQAHLPVDQGSAPEVNLTSDHGETWVFQFRLEAISLEQCNSQLLASRPRREQQAAVTSVIQQVCCIG